MTNPTAKTNLNVARYPLGTATNGEVMKTKKHKDKIRDGGFILVSYVV